jgi:hypothetical protein
MVVFSKLTRKMFGGSEGKKEITFEMEMVDDLKVKEKEGKKQSFEKTKYPTPTGRV